MNQEAATTPAANQPQRDRSRIPAGRTWAAAVPCLAVSLIAISVGLGVSSCSPSTTGAPQSADQPTTPVAAPATGEMAVAPTQLESPVTPGEASVAATEVATAGRQPGEAPAETAQAETTPAETMPGGTGESVTGEIVELEPSTHVLKGQPAPDLTMTELSTGETVSLADLKGRPVLVTFWATWCLPCRVELPWFQAAYEKYSALGLAVLAVDAGEQVPPSLAVDTISRYVDSQRFTFTVLYGDNTYDVQRAWSVIDGRLPMTFLVAPDGVVADVRAEAYPNQATFENHIQQILP